MYTSKIKTKDVQTMVKIRYESRLTFNYVELRTCVFRTLSNDNCEVVLHKKLTR